MTGRQVQAQQAPAMGQALARGAQSPLLLLLRQAQHARLLRPPSGRWQLVQEAARGGPAPWPRAAAAGASLLGPPAAALSTLQRPSPVAVEHQEEQLTANTEVAAAVAACARSLGRVPGAAEAQLASSLQEHWYATAGDVAAMTEEEARALQVPFRLVAQLRRLLAPAAGPAPLPVPEEAATALSSDASHSGRRSEQFTQTSSSMASAPAAAPKTRKKRSQAAGAATGSVPDASDAAVASQSAGALSPAAADDEQSDAEPSTSGSGQGEGQGEEDILSRRASKFRRMRGSAWMQPVTKRKRLPPYGLKAGQESEALAGELAAFHTFLTTKWYGQQEAPIAPVTARKYADHVRYALGWLHNVRGVPAEQLALGGLVPSPAREGVALAFDYLAWLGAERGISVTTEALVIRSLMAVAKFLYHKQSQAQPGDGDKAYADLLVVRELRKLANTAAKGVKIASRAADEKLKWLTWPEFLQVVAALKQECAGRNVNGQLRSRQAVAWSVQRYLLFAILACVPDRQRTLRELQLGRTLFHEDGLWVIRHGAGDYKTGKAYGQRPPLVLSPGLYPELTAWLDTWRAELAPSHDYVFTCRDGQPLADRHVYEIFSRSAYRITGKRTNPHLVRDIVVTHLRSSGASERELEALALYMGHSMDMQRNTYDRRTKSQKVEPAVALLAALNAQALTPSPTPSAV